MNSSSVAANLSPTQIRQARRFSVQLVYQLDLNQALFADDRTFQVFFNQFQVPSEEHSFIQWAVNRTLARLTDIDALVSKCSTHWKISRIAKVDLAVLRICSLELMERSDTAVDIIIADAVEIGKEFGSGNSSSFINGVLDSIMKSVRSAG